MLQLRKCSYQRSATSNPNIADNYASMIPMSVIDNGNPTAGPMTQIINQNNIIGLNVPSSQNINNSNFAAASNVNMGPISPLQAAQVQYDDPLDNPMNLEWINKHWVQQIIRSCAVISFISICANTPETFKNHLFIMVMAFVCDVICTAVFTGEMIAKIKIKGFFRGDSTYLFDRWCQFDGIMVIFHLISVVLQVSFILI